MKNLTLKKIWKFFWDDDSIWSWLLSVLVAFVVIKFMVYPLLSLGLGTTHPIVAVVSGSMEHRGLGFDEWWSDPDACCRRGVCSSQAELYEEYAITDAEFEEFRFRNGFNKGDLMVLVSAHRKPIEVGDVLVFTTRSLQEPIIHRVVLSETVGSDSLMTTKGDNNCALSPFEKKISEDRFVGKAVLRIPLLGWIKIGFVSLIDGVRGVFQ